MNIYETTFSCLCPNGALKDHYNLEVRSNEIIPVEFILQAIKELPKEAYQEDIADSLRAKLGASVTVVGWHYSVKITSERP
jgi:hypothetical protein